MRFNPLDYELHKNVLRETHEWLWNFIGEEWESRDDLFLEFSFIKKNGSDLTSEWLRETPKHGTKIFLWIDNTEFFSMFPFSELFDHQSWEYSANLKCLLIFNVIPL